MVYSSLVAVLFLSLLKLFKFSEQVINGDLIAGSENLLKGHSDAQLILLAPLLPRLTANTTVAIFVTTTDIYYQGYAATTYFSCTNGSFQVETLVDNEYSFFIDPFIQGECTAFANSTSSRLHQSNTRNYNISTPMNITLFTDMPFNAGEDILLIVMASNEVEVPVTLGAICGVVTYIQNVTTSQLTSFTLPANFSGINCYFQTITLPDFYNEIIPYPFAMVPLLSISSPTNGTNYTSGNFIEAVISSSNGLNHVVTLNLNCFDALVTSLTQSISATFSLSPPSDAFGDCLLYVSEEEGYDILSPVNININRQLYFVNPVQNQIIYSDGMYYVLIEALGGVVLDPVNIEFTCEIGGSFTRNADLGSYLGFAMNTYSQGPCTVVAYSNVPYYLNSSVIGITVMTLLTSSIPIPPIVVAGDTIQIQIDSAFSTTVPVVVSTTCNSQIDSIVIDSSTYSSYIYPILFTGVPCFMSFTSLQYFVNITNVPVIVAMTPQQIYEFSKLITFPSKGGFLRLKNGFF